MENEELNPFLFGSVVREVNYCLRAPLQKSIHDRLRSGQNLYLVGPRRVGKTSLVERIAERHFKKRYFRVDFMTVKTAEEATEWILNAWLSYERAHKRVNAAMEFLTSLNLDVSILGNRVKVAPGERLNRLTFDTLFAQLDRKPKKNEAPMLIFFDEFQSLLELEQEERFAFLGKLRKGIQHLKHVRVVYAGSVAHAVQEIFQSTDSPFYNAAEAVDVGPIEPAKKFRAFLTAKFLDGGRTPGEGFWEEVETITARIPSDMQRLCAAVWETTRRGQSLGNPEIENALERIFGHEQWMNQSIIEHSTAIQKKCLKGIADFGGKSPTSLAFLEKVRHKSGSGVLKALGSYVKSGVLYKRESEFVFSNPFLREWLIRRDV
ncbi:MAG: hypothetical protein ACSHYB_03400 [Roseibacillus sp.]